MRSTFRSFPGPPPPQGWQGSDRCPRSFARRITPSHVRVGTPGHHRVRWVVLLPPLRHFSIDLADGCVMCISILWSHADYYGGSVALGLAPGRRSRISPTSYVRARLRSSTHPYARDVSPGIPSCGLAGPETRRSGTRWPHGISLWVPSRGEGRV